MKITTDNMKNTILELLVQRNLSGESASLCASIITESTTDGVLSHGIARLPNLLAQLDGGEIDPVSSPVLIGSSGFPGIEQYDGQQGVGISNAAFATNRAMELAGKTGISLVSLRNTSHWFRAGSYGWQAVRKGYALICWTNTTPNMPPWGSTVPQVGNNPLVIAVPGETPEGSTVIDMAMSQYSWGSIHQHTSSQTELDVPGGWDRNGELTTDPGEILHTGRALPAGFWKGTGLSIILDLFAAAVSGGKATRDIPISETCLSQVFIAVRMSADERSALGAELESLATDFMEAAKKGKGQAHYPGQRSISARKAGGPEGIEIPDQLWAQVLALKRS